MNKILTKPYEKNQSKLSGYVVVKYPSDDTPIAIKEIKILAPYFYLSYVRNYDIGFSVLGILDSILTPKQKATTLKLLQLIAVSILLLYFLSQKMQFFFPFLLIISGGLGNALDRFYQGYVTDFLKVVIVPDSNISLLDPWPIFNLADIYISIGVFLLIIMNFKISKTSNGQN